MECCQVVWVPYPQGSGRVCVLFVVEVRYHLEGELFGQELVGVVEEYMMCESVGQGGEGLFLGVGGCVW